MSMEAEKFQDLKFTRWSPHRGDGVGTVQVQRPENQENQWCNFQPKSSRLKIQEKPTL